MNKTELIDKLLHLGNTTEMCCSTDRHNAKELAHTLLDEYLQAIKDTHSCESDSEQLVCENCKYTAIYEGYEISYLECMKCGKTKAY